MGGTSCQKSAAALKPPSSPSHKEREREKGTDDVDAGKLPVEGARPREGPIENGESVQKAAMYDREARLSAGT